jgi:hypothetical protein
LRRKRGRWSMAEESTGRRQQQRTSGLSRRTRRTGARGAAVFGVAGDEDEDGVEDAVDAGRADGAAVLGGSILGDVGVVCVVGAEVGFVFGAGSSAFKVDSVGGGVGAAFGGCAVVRVVAVGSLVGVDADAGAGADAGANAGANAGVGAGCDGGGGVVDVAVDVVAVAAAVPRPSLER